MKAGLVVTKLVILTQSTQLTAILKETADDLGNANSLKERADQAKIKADKMLSTAKQVLGALDEGKTCGYSCI